MPFGKIQNTPECDEKLSECTLPCNMDLLTTNPLKISLRPQFLPHLYGQVTYDKILRIDDKQQEQKFGFQQIPPMILDLSDHTLE